MLAFWLPRDYHSRCRGEETSGLSLRIHCHCSGTTTLNFQDTAYKWKRKKCEDKGMMKSALFVLCEIIEHHGVHCPDGNRATRIHESSSWMLPNANFVDNAVAIVSLWMCTKWEKNWFANNEPSMAFSISFPPSGLSILSVLALAKTLFVNFLC